MATGSGVAINFNSVPGLLYEVGRTTYLTKNALRILARSGVTLSADSVDFIAFTPNQDCNILGIITLTGNVAFRIFDEFGNIDNNYPLITATGVIGAFKANKNYLLQITNSSAITSGTSIGSLAITTTPTVSTYFTNGFAPQVPITGNPTFSTNSFGAITFTFTNYPAVLGQPKLLAIATFAKQALNGPGEGVAFTCSDNTFENNSIFPFAINQTVGIYFNPLKSGSFTGTVFVTLTNAGTTTAGNLIPVLE